MNDKTDTMESRTPNGTAAIVPDTADRGVRMLLDILVAKGLRNAIISPGSRNAPLIIGISSRSEIKTEIIADERTASFAALGISMTRQRPVLLCCTSGTAIYNYAPAVAEAYYRHIPLIIITADRPKQWIDQDDSQTLRQADALALVTTACFDIPPGESGFGVCSNSEYGDEYEWMVNRIANEAYNLATGKPGGPVHINIQLATPLNRTVPKIQRNMRCVEKTLTGETMSVGQLRELSNYLMERRVLVTAGFMPPSNKLTRAMRSFGALPNVTVMAESLSNLHLPAEDYCIDGVLAHADREFLERMRPDVVISAGGALVSRKLKEYIRTSSGCCHWTLGDARPGADCFQRLARHIDVSPEKFFGAAASMCRTLGRKGVAFRHPDYNSLWKEAKVDAQEWTDRYIRESGWSEMLVFDYISRKINREWNLFLANGTPVRHYQLTVRRLPHANYCNRGVSGIEGMNATALGGAMAYNGTTLLVTGDMSFGYCTDILNSRYSEADLRIIVINNGGGGIFRFIESTRNLEVRDRYFCADPRIPVEGLCKAYGWRYESAASIEELERGWSILASHRRTLLEIKVDPDSSAEILRGYFR